MRFGRIVAARVLQSMQLAVSIGAGKNMKNLNNPIMARDNSRMTRLK